MAILTKFLQLLKPEKNDYVDVEKHLSENYDKIDTKMEELSNSNDEKLNKGNVPDVLNSAEKIIKALQGNTGIKFDENLLYLNDSGTKKKGYCYIDKLTDGIFECIQETTTTVNNATYFKNFSNKENSDRLSNLKNYKSSEVIRYNDLKLQNGNYFKPSGFDISKLTEDFYICILHNDSVTSIGTLYKTFRNNDYRGNFVIGADAIPILFTIDANGIQVFGTFLDITKIEIYKINIKSNFKI